MLNPAIDLECSHEHVAGMSEVFQLTANTVRPLFSMEEIAAKPVDDDQKGNHRIPLIGGFVTKRFFHKFATVIPTQTQPVEVLSRLAIRKVPSPEVFMSS